MMRILSLVALFLIPLSTLAQIDKDALLLGLNFNGSFKNYPEIYHEFLNNDNSAHVMDRSKASAWSVRSNIRGIYLLTQRVAIGINYEIHHIQLIDHRARKVTPSDFAPDTNVYEGKNNYRITLILNSINPIVRWYCIQYKRWNLFVEGSMGPTIGKKVQRVYVENKKNDQVDFTTNYRTKYTEVYFNYKFGCGLDLFLTKKIGLGGEVSFQYYAIPKEKFPSNYYKNKSIVGSLGLIYKI